MIHRNFWVVRVLGPLLDGNQRQTQAAKVRNILFVEKRKERLNGAMQRNLENIGPLCQVGN
jgi:hypothetical protein